MFYVVKVETIGACTRKCKFCKFGNGFKSDFSKLDWNIIKKIVFELKENKFIGRLSWFGMNEPLLDDRIYDIIKFSRKELPNVFLSLQTNGDLLDSNKIKLLFNNGLDYLGVSIYDDITYLKIKKLLSNFYLSNKVKLKDCRDIKKMNLENRGGNIKNIFNKINTIKLNCLRPKSTIYINFNGYMKLCEGDLNNSNVNFFIQNNSIYKIYNNNIYQSFIKQLKEEGRKGLNPCEKCNYMGYRSNPYFPLKHPDTY